MGDMLLMQMIFLNFSKIIETIFCGNKGAQSNKECQCMQYINIRMSTGKQALLRKSNGPSCTE